MYEIDPLSSLISLSTSFTALHFFFILKSVSFTIFALCLLLFTVTFIVNITYVLIKLLEIVLSKLLEISFFVNAIIQSFTKCINCCHFLFK